jgi:hypothetical protein
MENKKKVSKYTNINIAQQNAHNYLGEDAKLYISPLKTKKYRIFNPILNKWVDFGSMNPPMEDFTKHKDKERQQRYLKRASKIKGDWKNNPYSPNNLSMKILWK